MPYRSAASRQLTPYFTISKRFIVPPFLRKKQRPCVVLASDGYPVKYEKGFKITGFEKFDGKEDYYCYHAGTKFDADGNIVTNGGRVLGITATGATLKEARAKAYEATEWVQFDNKYMRHDIGKAIDEA